MMNLQLLHPADQLVITMQRIYGYGMTTTSGGNLSILDDNGDIWITPAGVDKGALSRNDIVCVKKDGAIKGIHKPSSEWPFHKMIYEQRNDIKALIHAHPPALVSFSIVRRIPDTMLIPNAHIVSGPVTMAGYALPGSERLGEKISQKFAEGYDTVMLENHGVVVGSNDLFKAFMAFETLDFCAQLEINACLMGEPRPLTQNKLEIYSKKQDVNMEDFIPHNFSHKETEGRREMCKLINRAYQQRLFTSTQGTFSQRLEETSFFITPYGIDRKYMEAGDLLRIEKGKKEAGKKPSRSARLHQHIYEKHPDINSIIIAHPPNIMTFSVTDCEMETKTIPESYVMLGRIPKVPFGESFLRPQKTAERFSKSTSVLLVENDCVIVTARSLLEAFDKLEVAEFTAKTILSAKGIGSVIDIDKKQIREIEEAFDLH